MRNVFVLLISLLLFGCATEVPGLIGATDFKLSMELRAKAATIARKAGPVQPVTTEAVLHSRARGNFGSVILYDQQVQSASTADGLQEEVRSIAPRSARAASEYERSLSLCGLVDLLSESTATPPRSEIALIRTTSSVLPVVTSGGLPSGGRYLVLSLDIDHPSPCSPKAGDKIVILKTGQLLRRVAGPIGTLQRLQDVEEKMTCVVSPGVALGLPSHDENDLLQVSCRHESTIGWPIASTFAYLRSGRQYLPLLNVRAEGTDIRYEYKSIR